MYKKSRSSILLAGVVLSLVSFACAAAQPSTPTVVPTNTLVPVTDTATVVPTLTPRPTATPNIAATQKADARQTDLESYLSKGYITKTDGYFTAIDDFHEEWAQINWYEWWPIGSKAYSNLVFQGHFAWSTGISTPETSGCGVTFGLQDNQNHYAVFVDQSRILFLMGRGKTSYLVGKTRGTGRLNLSNPGEADVVVIVKDQKAFVGVNKEFTEYTGFKVEK